ncbi:MAG: lipoyl(octanoyl) transferase LipB [Chloroflexota bacterium]|nr:lipoyl(octanoyl) transferase LipB [Chloroflexota bacterium]
MTVATSALRVVDLGQLEYAAALLHQRALAAERAAGRGEDTLLLVEHPPTITLGRGARREHVLLPESELARRGVALYATDRGGDVTYHGPGQLVGYPILDLAPRGRDLHRYLRDLEQLLIDTLAELGIRGERVHGRTGVWVGERKIAAIGIKVSRWVTSHGFALNVGPDLSGFALIIPCGIRDRGVTSISQELGVTVEIDAVKPLVVRHAERIFGAAP